MQLEPHDNRHLGIAFDTQAQIDALRKSPEPFVSKIAKSRIAKGR